MTDYLDHIPHELKEAIRKQTLITFVGAGLSYEMKNTEGQKLEGWKNMVQQLLTHLESSHNVSHLTPLLALYDPIEVLNLIEKDKSLPKEKVYDFMKEFFDLDEDANDYSLHEDIANLTNKIITTNYDTAFEIAKPRLRRFKAYKGKNYELTKHKEAHANLLFKLHGCFEESDSMVLFPSDYDALYDNENNKDAEHSLLVLRNILQNNTLLIVGAGMGDHQINTIFKELKRIQGDYAQKHFITTTEPLDSSLDFLTPIKIKDYEEIPAVIQALLKLKEKTTEKEEGQKTQELEKQLAEAQEKIKTLETQGKLSNKDTQEKKALKYFSQGVEYSLAGEHEKASEKYEIATDLKEDYYKVYYFWGTSLGILAREKTGSEKEKLFKQAFEKYQLAIKYKIDDHQTYHNWGTDLGVLAREKTDIEKEKLFKQACKKFEAATKHNVNFHEAYNNWGNTLIYLALERKEKEKEQLFALAFEKFEIATKQKKDNYLNHDWETVLGKLNHENAWREKEQLLSQAIEKQKLAKKHTISKIKIKHFGPIKEQKEGEEWIDITKVTAFIGDQGSGKSTIAKLISLFSWIEKVLVRGDYDAEWFQKEERFKENLLAYHRLENYLQEKTEIEYHGEAYKLSYTKGHFLAKEKESKSFSLPQVMYVPAERNFIAYAQTPNELKLSSDSLKEFLTAFEQAKQDMQSPISLPLRKAHLHYLHEQDSLHIEHADEYNIDLREASSGFQSIVPLYLVSAYLTRSITGQKKEKMSNREIISFRKQALTLSLNKDLTDEQKRMSLSTLASKFNKSSFINIVEEPEQNLFPSSQWELLKSLLEFNNTTQENKLIITTHSPYIINYLSIAIQAASLKFKIPTENDLLMKQFKEITPLSSTVYAKDVAIYEVFDNGTFKKLDTYEGIPSDQNFLNHSLGQTNELFDALLEIEQAL